MSNFLLSLCIPTFNRAPFLRETLESIVLQPAFHHAEDIEIVISDNCSTDTTETVSMEYVERFPGKVNYFRQPQGTNPTELNFVSVLEKADGRFLKLHNDNLLFMDASLEKIVDTLRDPQTCDASVVFFTNGLFQHEGTKVVNNLNDFVRSASYMATWIASFCVARCAFLSLDNVGRHAGLRLIQTDILYRIMAGTAHAVLVYDTLFKPVVGARKGGFNIAEVFGKNYLELMREFVQSNALAHDVYLEEKLNVFAKHTFHTYFDSTNGYEKTGFFVHMRDYIDEPYFFDVIEKMLFLAFDAGRKIKGLPD